MLTTIQVVQDTWFQR